MVLPGHNELIHDSLASFMQQAITWTQEPTKTCSQEFNLQLTSIGSDNGLAPNRCQAII